MSKKLFNDEDIFINRLKMHPELEFFIQDSKVYINNNLNIAGISGGNTNKNVPPGFISLFELNINRRSNNLAFPFVQSGSNNQQFGNVLHGNFGTLQINSDIYASSSYPLSSSIIRKPTTTQDYTDNSGQTITLNLTGSTLYNIGRNKYCIMSKRFAASALTASTLNIIDIPSIFYGSSIKKGSLQLKYFVTGTMIASAIDERQNGEIISDFGNSSGSVVGLVYYDEGVLMFPKKTSGGSTTLFQAGNNYNNNYFYDGVLDADNAIRYDNTMESASWGVFGCGANDTTAVGTSITQHVSLASASYSINFKGTTYKNTLTLMCHAEKGEMNWSNNPTYLDQKGINYNQFKTSSLQYYEHSTPIKNVFSSSYHGHSASLQKTTYISKVGIYDENGNLIMTAEMARPYRKQEEKDITFKLKYDLI